MPESRKERPGSSAEQRRRKARGKKRAGRLAKKLGDSPINYFSDLFIVAMVIGWIIVLVIMVIMAIYATLRLENTDIWAYVWELTGIPLSAGGAIWMIKNTVQHNIAGKQGKECPQDFPAVTDDIEIYGMEEPMRVERASDAEEGEDDDITDDLEEISDCDENADFEPNSGTDEEVENIQSEEDAG